jgi:tRNA(Ile)-lysidine synthase
MYLFKKQNFVAAVSGGPDSMAMLHMYIKKITHVLHVNYHKRDDSNLDEEVVRNFCKLNNLKFASLNVDDEIYSKYVTNNFQNKARLIRYDFFLKYFIDNGILNTHELITAHNFDDFMETAVMQEQRKSTSPFYGIKISSHYKEMQIFRPVMRIRKETLRRYCQEFGVQFRDDYTNFQDIYQRNITRKKVIEMSTHDFAQLYKKFRVYNKKNNKLVNKANKKYIAWESSDFLVQNYISIKNAMIRKEVLYLFLSNKMLSSTSKKIDLLDEHIIKSTKNTGIMMNKNITIAKKNKKLVTIYSDTIN